MTQCVVRIARRVRPAVGSPAWCGLAMVAGLLLASGGWAAADLDGSSVQAIAADPVLMAQAARRAQAQYARHCAGCHGEGRQGDATRGVPNLADAHWLWGDATADSELDALVETLRVGIRSSHPQTRRVAVMPAYGPSADAAHRLTPAQIDAVTEHVLQLAGQPHDAAAARQGRALFRGQANCFNCHGPDGSGNSDWGASDLTAPAPGAWVYGSGRDAIRQSIADGRGGQCPAWGGRLDNADLKSLAVWLRATPR